MHMLMKCFLSWHHTKDSYAYINKYAIIPSCSSPASFRMIKSCYNWYKCSNFSQPKLWLTTYPILRYHASCTYVALYHMKFGKQVWFHSKYINVLNQFHLLLSVAVALYLVWYSKWLWRNYLVKAEPVYQ